MYAQIGYNHELENDIRIIMVQYPDNKDIQAAASEYVPFQFVRLIDLQRTAPSLTHTFINRCMLPVLGLDKDEGLEKSGRASRLCEPLYKAFSRFYKEPGPCQFISGCIFVLAKCSRSARIEFCKFPTGNYLVEALTFHTSSTNTQNTVRLIGNVLGAILHLVNVSCIAQMKFGENLFKQIQTTMIAFEKSEVIQAFACGIIANTLTEISTPPSNNAQVVLAMFKSTKLYMNIAKAATTYPTFIKLDFLALTAPTRTEDLAGLIHCINTVTSIIPCTKIDHADIKRCMHKLVAKL